MGERGTGERGTGERVESSKQTQLSRAIIR